MALVGDLRYGVRQFARAPGFTVAALAALALGMGASTAIFSVVDAVLLKALPFREPGRLVVIWEKNPPINKRFHLRDGSPVAPVNFQSWQQQSGSLEAMAAIQDTRLNLSGGPGTGEAEEIKVEMVSPNLFRTLGIQPALGRAFSADEGQAGRAGVALLSHALWTQRFGADPAIAGKSILLGGRSYSVIGVMPAGFAVIEAGCGVWTPLALDFNDPRVSRRRNLQVIARLKDGIGMEQARQEMEIIGARLEQADPALNAGFRPSLIPLREQVVGDVQRPLLVLAGAVGLLLLIACVNVANLQLTRGTARQKEIAVRMAMGAGRGRVVRQLLTESLVLSLAGGMLGTILAAGGVAVLARLGAGNLPRLANAAPDWRMFLFVLAVSVATGIGFGTVPALQISGGRVGAALNQVSRGSAVSRSARRARNALVVCEIGLAVTVLIGAGLLVRSFIGLRRLDPGFRPEGVLAIRLPLSGGRNMGPDRRIAFVGQVAERLAALPGVESAGAVNTLPLTGLDVGTMFAIAGMPAPPSDQRPQALVRSVTPAYFRTMGIPLVGGRAFTAGDTAQSPVVAIVDRSFARRWWPEGAGVAIGRRITLDFANARVAEIVGVVGDVRPDKLEPEKLAGENWPTIYIPYPQGPFPTMQLVVRAAGSPLALAPSVEREVHRLDPDQLLADVQPMEGVVDGAMAAGRFSMSVMGAFAAIAFVLAAVGIFGVISYDVNQRKHEIGIRLALGATRGDLLRLILGEGAQLAGIGIAAGVAGALLLTPKMEDMLYGVKAADPVTFVAIPLLLGAVALAATYVPSRQAASLEPVNALRHE